MGAARAEDTALLDTGRCTFEVEGDIYGHRLAEIDSHEVDMSILAAEWVSLYDPGDRRDRVSAIDLEIDDGVSAGLGVKRNVKVVRVDLDRYRLQIGAIDDGGHVAGATNAP
jgi:hypothetical protein